MCSRLLVEDGSSLSELLDQMISCPSFFLLHTDNELCTIATTSTITIEITHREHWAEFCSVVGGCLVTKRIFSCVNCGTACFCKAFVCQNACVGLYPTSNPCICICSLLSHFSLSHLGVFLFCNFVM